MQKLQNILRILLYLSVGFVIYYLYTFDFLVFNQLTINWWLMAAAILVLWAGFVMSALSWRVNLAQHQVKVGSSLAIYSHGISVFAKYMPGKIWVILGRASLVSEKTGSLAQLSTISLKEQLIYLFMGMVVSTALLPFVPINPLLLLAILLVAVGLGAFLFIKPIHNLVLKLVNTLTRRNFEVPFLTLNQVVKVGWAIFLYWFLWSLGFYLLVLSLIPGTPAIAALIFPASVCFGLIAIFFPGGIGVREGIIVLFLKGLGVDPQLAITLSVIQRLWFVSGEVFIFCTAFLIRKFKL